MKRSEEENMKKKTWRYRIRTEEYKGHQWRNRRRRRK